MLTFDVGVDIILLYLIFGGITRQLEFYTAAVYNLLYGRRITPSWVASCKNKVMKIKKLSLFIFALVLVGCSSTYEDIHTSTPLAQPEPFSTITAIPTIAHQLTNTPKPLPTLTFIPSPTPLAESTQSISCWQSAMAQLEMNQCASQEYQVKYDKLNELIVELKSHMNDTQYEILLRVQADWKIL